uniref:Si:dkey-4p15.5 n=1 Tax=Neolamprologus brichardi TaxID=32507 RepID=A0A3Q4I696_NEOBR
SHKACILRLLIARDPLAVLPKILFAHFQCNSDISVTCGTENMDLSIYLCPIYNAFYNESLMVINNQITNPRCYGTADFIAVPPRLKFSFPINTTSLSFCNNNFEVTYFSDFSNVQFVNISGTVTSIDPAAGTITYRPQILYKFSCKYPMQYLLNNTNLAVYFSVEQDQQYQQLLTIPETGLDLKTKIYVSVKATNLTKKFNVLLDRCFATTSPYPTQSTSYDLFVGCTRDAQTVVEQNGVSHTANFNFEAFRFVEHKNRTVSAFYLHCATRLCEASTCSTLLPVSGRDLFLPDILKEFIFFCITKINKMDFLLSLFIFDRTVAPPKIGKLERWRLCRPMLQSPLPS